MGPVLLEVKLVFKCRMAAFRVDERSSRDQTGDQSGKT